MPKMSDIDKQLLFAVRRKRLDEAAEALSRGANSSASEDGFSALTEALIRGDAAMTRLLLEAGAALEWEGMIRTPLSVAILTESMECFEALLEAGAPIEGSLSNGMTPLMESLLLGEKGLGFAAALARRGASVEARDADGETPLFYAMASGSLEAVALALREGADPLALDFQGGNVAQRARAAGADDNWIARVAPMVAAAIEKQALEGLDAGPRSRSARGLSL